MFECSQIVGGLDRRAMPRVCAPDTNDSRRPVDVHANTPMWKSVGCPVQRARVRQALHQCIEVTIACTGHVVEKMLLRGGEGQIFFLACR